MNRIPSNVLLLTDEMLPGGVSRHVIDLANGLKNNGINVIVAATDGPFRYRLDENIPFVELHLLKKNSYAKNIIGYLSAYLKLRSIIRHKNIELVHTHKRYSDLLGRVLAREFGMPHLCSCHNTFENLKLFSVFGDHTITCSNAVQNILIKKYHMDPKKVKTTYYGIKPFSKITDIKKIEVYDQLGVSHDKIIIASVGQLIKAKDRETLLQAIYLLSKDVDLDKYVFVILGDGDMKNNLIQIRDELGLENTVKFVHGTFDVELLFNISAFMVLSSVREGFGYVFLEAASIGKPHIATDVGGVSEAIIHNQTGLLVPPKNPEALANAIQTFLSNPSMVSTMGENAKKRFTEKFGYDRFIVETLGTYMSFLNSKYENNVGTRA